MIIDSHCHFNLEPLYDTLHVLDAPEYQDFKGLCVGTSSETTRRAIEISKKYQNKIYATVGLHPGYLDMEDSVVFFSEIDPQDVIAVGECGYDFFRTKRGECFEKQTEVFDAQVQYAISHNLPLMIHSRSTPKTFDAYDDVLAMLSKYKNETGYRGAQIHFFAGDESYAEKFLDLGCMISFTGIITYGPSMHSVVAYIPHDRILCETDAPYVAPVPYRGEICYPIYVEEVYKKISEIKNIPYQDFVKHAEKNFTSFYRI